MVADTPSDAPNAERAREQYRRLAGSYDRRLRRSGRLRQAAVDRLQPLPGETVIDLGCGTGLSFPLLEQRIGPEGRLVGVELSREMAELARERTERHRWENVEVIEAPAETAEIPVRADALLSVLTHDIMRSPRALENVLGAVRPGGRVAVVGGKWAPRWAAPVNAVVFAIARRYVTTFEGLDRPWSHLERMLGDFEVEPLMLGAAYLAAGRVGPSGDSR
jgi:ubiquinone/menaquinone biosynthesis C-methylase UbiE